MSAKQFSIEQEEQLQQFLLLGQVLKLIPISRSAWYAGQKIGLYPQPIKLGHRTALYRFDDIQKLIAKIQLEGSKNER